MTRESVTQRTMLESLLGQDTSIAAWGLAQVQSSNQETSGDPCSAHCPQRSHVIGDFGTQSISNMAWAKTTLGVRNDGLLLLLSTRRNWGFLPTFIPQNIANLVWTCTKCDVYDTQLMVAPSKHIMVSSHIGNLLGIERAQKTSFHGPPGKRFHQCFMVDTKCGRLALSIGGIPIGSGELCINLRSCPRLEPIGIPNAMFYVSRP